jgi:hypothetical protein
LVTHQDVVPVNLAGTSQPAMREFSQKLGLGFALCQSHQAKTSCRLILAMLCAFHDFLASGPVVQRHLNEPWQSYVTSFDTAKFPDYPLFSGRTHGGKCTARRNVLGTI